MSFFNPRPETKTPPANPMPTPSPSPAPAPSPTPTATTTTASSRLTVIAEGTIMEGQLRVDGDLRIEGLVKGTVTTKGKVTMLKGGKVDGDVICHSAEISGVVNGKLKVADVLSLRANALIEGDIHTGKLVIENGVKFNGNCVMGAPATTTPTAAPTPTPPKPATGNTIDLNAKP